MQTDNLLQLFFVFSLRTFAALFWGALLLLYSRRSKQNLPLSIIFIIIGLLYMRNGFVRFPSLEIVDVYNPLSYFVLLFIAPFTIFYAWFSIGEKHPLKHYLLQFIPFAVMLCLWGLLQLSDEARPPFCFSLIDVINNRAAHPLHVGFFIVLILVFIAQVFAYFSTALVKFIRVWNIYKENDISRRPIKVLVAMDTIFLIYPLAGVLYMSFNNADFFAIGFNIFVSIAISLVSILNISLILPVKTDLDFIADAQKRIKSAYNSIINVAKNNDDKELLEGIKRLFDEKEFFRLPQLTLDDIATELHTNRSYVSTCINTHFGCNFRQLLVSYRIDAAKELLLNTEFDVQTIIEETGFNTRTSFYKAFREQVSEQPPMEWRKKENNKFS